MLRVTLFRSHASFTGLAQSVPTAAPGVVRVVAANLLGFAVDAVLDVVSLAQDGLEGIGDVVQVPIAVRRFEAGQRDPGDRCNFRKPVLRQAIHELDGVTELLDFGDGVLASSLRLSSHDGLLRFVQFRLLFREAAGYLNTVVGPPADFPFRVLYSCALPGHKPPLSRIAVQRETYRREKAALTVGSGFRLRRCVQHLTRILTPRNQAVNTFFRRRKRNVCRAPKEQINQLLRIPLFFQERMTHYARTVKASNHKGLRDLTAFLTGLA